MKRKLVDIVHLLLAATLVAACGEGLVVDPKLPSGAVAFNPPPEYTRWWAMAEACSGQLGSMASVTFVVVPHTADFQLNGETVTSYWTAGSNSIVLADGVRLEGSVVRHEMLHAITKAKGHPRADFLERCGGVVSCSTQCIADAGSAPKTDPGIPVVPADSLEVSIGFVPEAPSLATDSGSFTMIVSVHNPASHPVVAAVPEVIKGVSTVYTYVIRNPFGQGNSLVGSRYIADPSVFVFAANETKHQYFDLFIAGIPSTRAVIPGTYDITGSYGHRSLTLPSVVLALR